jgi:hypothetical protein
MRRYPCKLHLTGLCPEVTMVSLTSLWMPILVAAVLVFVASSVMHMMLTYHRSDFRPLPDEEKILSALRPFRIPPGDYFVPHASSMAAMKDPKFMEKMNAGPVAFMTVSPNGPPTMGASLVQWFAYSLIVGLFAAYIASRTLPSGTDYLRVFQITGAVAFAGYALAHLQNSIWMKRNWGATFKAMIDGLVYALLTGGTFGWLWPR